MALVQVGQGGIMLVKRGIPLAVPQVAVLMGPRNSAFPLRVLNNVTK